MKLVAQITIEIDAETFMEAGTHEKEVTSFFQDIQQKFGQSRLEIKERRARGAERKRHAAGPLPHYTGNLSVYHD